MNYIQKIHNLFYLQEMNHTYITLKFYYRFFQNVYTWNSLNFK